MGLGERAAQWADEPRTQSSRARRSAIAASVAALTALAAGDAAASPQDVIGYGPRAASMAGSGVAIGEGFETVYTNPALLAYARFPELDLGVEGAVFDVSANKPLETDGLAATMLGGVLPFPLPEPLRDRIVLGFGFLTPFDVVVRSRILYPETPQFLMPDAVESISAIVGLGVDLGYGVHIGGGFMALAALAGTVLVSVDASGQLGAVVQDTLVASYAPVVGVSVDLPYGLRVGTTVRGSLIGKFDVRVDIKDLGQVTVPPIFVSGTAQYDPLTVEAELAHVTGPIHGSIGVGWRRWSEYPGLAEATVRCPLDVTTFELPICGALKKVPPEFNDTAIVRASLEYSAKLKAGLDFDVRSGYAFESAPGPEQTGESNLFAEARSIVGLGAGVDVHSPILKRLHVDFFTQVQVMHGRDHHKDASVSPTNPGAPVISTSGMMFAAGTTAGVAF
ncbi:MAG: hypothetical protein U0271_08920 [Polyangiaceae bacterium]